MPPLKSTPKLPQRSRLGRESWVAAARAALITGGIGAVKVERLAATLGVTTGSFYWHFKGRRELLAALQKDWATTNMEGMANAVRGAATAHAQFDAFIEVWVNERGYSPAYDSAMRDWARMSKEVEAAVIKMDRSRIQLLKGIFRGLGYDDDRAEVRARIMYFHQVGFYALRVRDDDATRLRLRPYYVEALRDGPGRSKHDGSAIR